MQHTVSLKQNHEFRRLYNRGKSAVSPYFAIYCRKTGRDYSRLGITTGVKLGNAVKRNFVRRRIRALYRTNEAGLQPGYDIVVVARTRAIFGRYADLERSFRQLTRKLGLTLGAAAGQHLAAVLGGHTLAEAVLLGTLALLGLIGTKHGGHLLIRFQAGSPGPTTARFMGLRSAWNRPDWPALCRRKRVQEPLLCSERKVHYRR